MSLKNEVTFSSVLFYAQFGISDLKKTLEKVFSHA